MIEYDKRFTRLVNLSHALLGRREHRCFHVSFILKKSRILAIGVNQIKTHPRMRDFGYASVCGLHSELDAALKLGLADCSGLTMINIRIDGKQRLNMSKPCQFCQRLIKDLNFKNVFFTDANGEFQSYYQN